MFNNNLLAKIAILFTWTKISTLIIIKSSASLFFSPTWMSKSKLGFLGMIMHQEEIKTTK